MPLPWGGTEAARSWDPCNEIPGSVVWPLCRAVFVVGARVRTLHREREPQRCVCTSKSVCHGDVFVSVMGARLCVTGTRL